MHQNLCGILGTYLPEAELGFWHIQGRHEVDFVISHGRQTIGLEIKAGSRFGRSDLNGLRAFQAKTRGLPIGVLAYNGTEAVSLGENSFAIPLSLLLS